MIAFINAISVADVQQEIFHLLVLQRNKAQFYTELLNRCNMMAVVLYILPFGLVRLRTFLLAHGLVRCNMSAGVHALAGRMCHSQMSK